MLKLTVLVMVLLFLSGRRNFIYDWLGSGSYFKCITVSLLIGCMFGETLILLNRLLTSCNF